MVEQGHRGWAIYDGRVIEPTTESAPSAQATSPEPDASPSAGVMVAGHVCLDIIPSLPPGVAARAWRPGSLDMIGPALFGVGGCVGNTGIALHRLGARTTLVARVGDDVAATALVRLIRETVPASQTHLRRIAGAAGSYSIVLNRPGQDRAISHFPGVNDTFVADDVPEPLLASSALLHVGYPTLMAAMVADDGRELAQLMTRAHSHGLATSLDLAHVTFGPGAQGVRWPALLSRVLPDVDVFLPSIDEAVQLLGRRVRRDPGGPDLESVAAIVRELLDLGVGIAGLKLGEHGLYVRSAAGPRIAAVPAKLRRLGAGWIERELHSTVFETRVAGTIGAGDSTIAGFLYALLNAWSPEDAVTAACAVGGASTEMADGTSGVPGWQTIAARLRDGWRRRVPAVGGGWRPAAAGELATDGGLRLGPNDRSA